MCEIWNWNTMPSASSKHRNLHGGLGAFTSTFCRKTSMTTRCHWYRPVGEKEKWCNLCHPDMYRKCMHAIGFWGALFYGSFIPLVPVKWSRSVASDAILGAGWLMASTYLWQRLRHEFRAATSHRRCCGRPHRSWTRTWDDPAKHESVVVVAWVSCTKTC